ncbi:hypothetical protein VP01_483g5 [Puccinia sorghi]|uniref:Uncharacterized protein n=1 Tax=Puccinia sorghi TaxID=27349 RepID=A0A0L6UMF5_9BASI|nr:hypothetical protein VP01_483g5 [Puccinia sorghi]
MASIASTLIRSYRLLQRGLLSTVADHNTKTFFRPLVITRNHQNKLITTCPPSTIPSAFFGPLRSFPDAGQATASSLAFGPLNCRHSHLLAFKPILASPFRALSGTPNWGLVVQPRQQTAANAVHVAQASSSQSDTVLPHLSPLADEILHDIVAVRFAFPAPSFDL